MSSVIKLSVAVLAFLACGFWDAKAQGTGQGTAPTPAQTGQAALPAVKRAPVKRVAPLPVARPRAATDAQAPSSAAPVYMSDEYMKREKETEERLKRAMTICKGC